MARIDLYKQTIAKNRRLPDSHPRPQPRIRKRIDLLWLQSRLLAAPIEAHKRARGTAANGPGLTPTQTAAGCVALVPEPAIDCLDSDRALCMPSTRLSITFFNATNRPRPIKAPGGKTASNAP